MARGKKYLDVRSKVDLTRLYSVDEALTLLEETKTAKFDETVDVAVKLEIGRAHV